MLKAIWLFSSMLIMSGCINVHVPQGIQPASTHEIERYKYTILSNEPVVGEDSVFKFFFIPFGSVSNKAAMNDAIKKYNADALIDVTFVKETKLLLFLFTGFETTYAYGKPVKFINN
jgi:hypothetical protein